MADTVTASYAVAAQPSAPMVSAHSWVVAPPPMRTLYLSRSPASLSASMTSRWPTRVVVSSAEMAMMSALTSFALLMKENRSTSMPRS